jgi:hypothetical protein
LTSTDDVSRDQVLVWLSDIARGSLCFWGVCDSLVIFARSKTVQGCVAVVLSGEHVGTRVFFLFVHLFVFLGIDFSRIYHISMLDWPPDTGLDAVFLGKRFQTHDTYKHNHSLFSTLNSLLSLPLSLSLSLLHTHTHTAQPDQSNLASHPGHATPPTPPMPRHSNLDSTSGKQVGQPSPSSAQFGCSVQSHKQDTHRQTDKHAPDRQRITQRRRARMGACAG